MADLGKAFRKWFLVWRIRLALWFLRSRKWIGIAVAAVLALLLLKRKAPARPVDTAKRQRDDAILASATSGARAKRAREEAAKQEAASVASEKAGAEAALGIRNGTKAQTESSLKAYAKRVRGVWPVLLLVFGLHAAHAAPVLAQEDPVAMEHPTSHAPGFWVPDDVTRNLLADAAELEGVHKALKESREAMSALFLVIDSQDAKARADLDVMSSLRFDAERAQADAEAAKAMLRAWYRRPAFLIGVGIVAGLIVPTVIVVAVQ